ncbi:hypothetical protein GLOIN_2v1575807 [Rhizophagus clarus]|uniref:Uncharacterized protein n=1 Tax=Rhizophagus clarus TaxID=94130 RepID=A0A8H3QLK4_9GLOM|nr:hypothetical protein GLOIN_2v1575807 [Rhizophagus clarus]
MFEKEANHLRQMNLLEQKIYKLIITQLISDYSQNVPGLISLIDTQRNLRSVSFGSRRNYEELSKVLAKKGCTINKLRLYYLDDIITFSFLTSLINLKDLSIYYELAMLIKKTKGSTSNKTAEYSGMLLETISNHCPKIEYIGTYLRPKDLIYVESLLMNCRDLISLFLDSLDETNNIEDELLDIWVCEHWKYSIVAFQNFLESYREKKSLGLGISADDFNNHLITSAHVDIVREYYEEQIQIF